MSKRWKRRPDGSNWGEFGPDDQLGRLNLITEERVLAAVKEVRVGKRFCLSLPLDLPGGNVINASRHPPQIQPVMRQGHVVFNGPARRDVPLQTDVLCDDAVTLHNQYSTQWDGFAHIGSMFDADGDGEPEPVFYNGYHVTDEKGRARFGEVGAWHLGVEHMAETGVQGRGVMIDLRAHLGDERHAVDHDGLMAICREDGVAVEPGDMVCLHTGLAQRIIDAAGEPGREVVTSACAVLDGRDDRLLQWVTDSGLAALISDNVAVEQSSSLTDEMTAPGPVLPLHEHCLFKLGIHLGELWYLSALAAWLREAGRNRFLLTAPPLRLPGAVGSPVTPVATV